MDSSYYVNAETIERYLGHRNIYVFGTGVEAETLTKKTGDYVNIVAYLDNFRCGKNNFFYGKNIYNVNNYLNIVDDSKAIVIATYRFG